MEEVIVSSVVNELAAKPSISDNGQDELAECLHIIGGTCVNDDQVFEADIIVENGLIKEIGPNLTTPDAATVVDAKGMLVLPGGIDTNTHFQLPVMGTVSADDFYSGTKAALAGGTTTIVDCVWDSPTTSLLEAYDKWKVWADSKVACNYGLSVGITKWDKTVADEMEVLVREKGVNTFRVSQEYKGLYMLDDGELLQVFSKCKELGALVTTLSENGHVIEAKAEELIGLGITGPEGHAMCRAEEVEAEAVNRAIVLANQARCPLAVVPITSKSSAKVISEARRKGYVVFGGSVAASLGVDGSHYWNQCWRHAAAYVTVPPLRPDPTVPAYLMEHLSSGDLQFTCSSHCTFNADQKAIGEKDFRKIPHGVNGVEERMPIIWQNGVHVGKMDVCRFVSITSSAAAKLFNIYPQKGRLAVGSDADIVVWNPSASKTISAKTQLAANDFNIFENVEVHGLPVAVICNGRVSYTEGSVYATPSSGRFVPTPPNSVYVYGRVEARDMSLAPQKVSREPYEGETVSTADTTDGKQSCHETPVKEENVLPTQVSDHFHQRPPTRAGGRNMQESSFSLTGEQFDDRKYSRPSSRVLGPPGGRSSGLW